ncbi:hypothetical protein [Candidatus Methylocalor cossyra]|uniref:AraC family transcriptional regulator n=1 Tax=Candidatus Methylocalor cossyra TaxID=3108543 RepID=A0ABM9NEN8_9GAMM
MNPIHSLLRAIEQSCAVHLLLKDGSLVRGFRPHDLIVRGPVERGILVVRGMVDPGGGQSPKDRSLPLGDIGGVFSAGPRHRFTPDPSFLLRNPVPRGWTALRPRLPEGAHS